MAKILSPVRPARTIATGTIATRTHAAPASVVTIPTVIGHRGASGHRPEHTLDAFRTAIRMGADGIELDLVMSRDGVLLVRHENELSRSTDVVHHPRFIRRCATRSVDGMPVAGWFTEDFTLAEIKQLTACERRPRLRPGNTAYDGLEGVPTLDEVLAMTAAESIRRDRQVTVMLELKHASHFMARGLDMVPALLATLRRHGFDGPQAPVTLMAFEPTVLQQLAWSSNLPIVQLLGRPHERPWDLACAGDDRTYADLAAPAGLDWIDQYADGIGAHHDLVLPPHAYVGGNAAVGVTSQLVRDAHRLGLTVHVWTLRAENVFLRAAHRIGEDPSALGDLAAEVRAFLAAGVDGVITDHPDLAVAARAAHLADGQRQQAG